MIPSIVTTLEKYCDLKNVNRDNIYSTIITPFSHYSSIPIKDINFGGNKLVLHFDNLNQIIKIPYQYHNDCIREEAIYEFAKIKKV